jgi:predicted transcriptional regulator
MMTLKAHVKNGQLVLDEPVELREGTAAVVHLLDDDEESAEERAAIEAEIDAGLAEIEAGQVVDDETVRAVIRAYR